MFCARESGKQGDAEFERLNRNETFAQMSPLSPLGPTGEGQRGKLTMHVAIF